MSLRISLGRISSVDHSILRLILDVVIQGIDRFARINAAGVIPEEAIVDRGDLRSRLEKVVAAPEQCEFLVSQGGDLALKGKQ